MSKMKFIALFLSCISYYAQANEPSPKTTSSREKITQSDIVADVAADFEVSGTVQDSDGNPLAGVTVAFKNTTVATVTDGNGHYRLSVPNSTGVLVFSYISYARKEVPIDGHNTIDVQLHSNISALNEVVVTGYSSQKKKDITGSVAVVDMDALKSVPSTTVEQALQGQASGVTVIGSGLPDGTSNVFIRGISSFGDTQPLVIVDGVQGSLHDLDADNIASIQVLKDAGAAAIYGVRGSNGVIVVTTKKGGSGAPHVSYDANVSYQVPPAGNVLNIANPEDMAAFIKKMDPNSRLFPDGVVPDYVYAGPGANGIGNEGDPAVDPSKYVFDAAHPSNDYLIQRLNKTGTDWFHQVFKPAFSQKHTLTVSGGTDKSDYLLSLGYLNQQGSLIETYVKRYSVRVNTDFKIKDKIRIGENAQVFYKQHSDFNNQDHDNAIFHTYTMPSFIPVYDIQGHYGGTWAGPEMGNRWNPVALMKNTANDKNNTWQIFGNIYAEADFLKHFTARTSFGGTVNNQYSHSFSPNRYQDLEQHVTANSFDEGSQYSSSSIWTNTVIYNQLFGKHSLKVLVGSEMIHNYGRGVGGSSTGFFSTDPNYLILNNGTSNITNYSNAHIDNLFSLFSRLDYAYKDKYLIAATVRRDGSSRFGPEMKYGVFPSFSAGWRMSNEPFMRGVHWINDLKLRGSWGKMGSQNNVPSTNAFTLYNSGFGTSYYDITGSGATQQGFYQSAIGNANTGWEEDIITNIGFDATILNGKFNISAEWYKKSTNGLLFPQPLPATVGGANSPIINIGDIQNKGLDVSVTYHGAISEDIRYNVTANITTYKNQVVKIPDPGYFDVGSVRNEVGHPVSSFFGYKAISFFADSADVAKSPTQEAAAPGLLKFADINHDGAITPADRTFVGDPNPDFTYGLNLSLSYRNFDFSMILYGSQGNQVLNSLRETLTHWSDFPEALSNDLVLEGWTPDNPNPKAPVAQNTSGFSSSAESFYIEDGSFLKCRSLMIGYDVKATALEKIGFSKLRVYVQGANLFDITKYSGLDPELAGSSEAFGIDNANYPNNFKSFILGVNVSF